MDASTISTSASFHLHFDADINQFGVLYQWMEEARLARIERLKQWMSVVFKVDFERSVVFVSEEFCNIMDIDLPDQNVLDLGVGRSAMVSGLDFVVIKRPEL